MRSPMQAVWHHVQYIPQPTHTFVTEGIPPPPPPILHKLEIFAYI
jgi:hypothetical protein